MRSALAALLLVLAAPARAGGGAERFDAAGCRSCHRVGPYGGSAGPDLSLVGLRRPRAWLVEWLGSPRHWKPDTRMPEQGLPASDRAAIAEFLSEQTGQAWNGKRPWDGLADAAEGKAIYLRAGCVACHGPAGLGGHPNPGAHGDVIPALASLMATYKKEELIARIKDGVKPEGHMGMTPAVVMPAWKGALSAGELDALADYLLGLGAAQPKTDW